jgi:hypothetical protein
MLQQAATLGDTPRYEQLDRYEAHLHGFQYQHQRLDWWGRNADAYETVHREAVFPRGFEPAGGPAGQPLTVRDKRPTAPANHAMVIVKEYTGMLVSEGHLPQVRVDGDPDTEAFLEAVREAAKFWPAMAMARDLGGGVGAACVTVHVRDGKWAYEVHNVKHLTPLWRDRRTWTPRAVLKVRKYPRWVDDRDEKTGRLVGVKQVIYVERRIITEEQDIVFQDIPLDAEEVTWELAPGQSVRHGLGRFPGVWVQNEADAEDMDGVPDCDGAWQLCDAYDRLLSQVNKGALNNVDPTPVLGLDPKEVSAQAGVRLGSDEAIQVGKSGFAEFLEMSGSAIEAAMRVLELYERKIGAITGYVSFDPQKVSGSAQSAKAIEYIKMSEIVRAAKKRGQYGPAIIELMRVTEEIARKFQPVSLADGRVGVFVWDLPPRKRSVERDGRKVDVVEDHQLGPGGYISLTWGPWFAATENDRQMVIANSTAANASGMVDRVTAAKPLAELYGVQDVEGMVARAQEEQAQIAERALAGADGGVPAPPVEDAGEAPGPAAGAGGRP